MNDRVSYIPNESTTNSATLSENSDSGFRSLRGLFREPYCRWHHIDATSGVPRDR